MWNRAMLGAWAGVLSKCLFEADQPRPVRGRGSDLDERDLENFCRSSSLQ